jgi:DNA-binding transcriptional ArsR family regulator
MSGNEALEPNRALGSSAIQTAKGTDCIKALHAPQRRRILRLLQDAGEARSPSEMAKVFGLPIGNVGYHVDVLEKCGALALTDTHRKRGATEHFYASTVTDNELVVGLLEATREDDE